MQANNPELDNIIQEILDRLKKDQEFAKKFIPSKKKTKKIEEPDQEISPGLLVYLKQ
jgi:hypothetical protein